MTLEIIDFDKKEINWTVNNSLSSKRVLIDFDFTGFDGA